MQEETQLLFAGIAGVLVFASVVGFALKYRAGLDQPHPVLDNLNARIKAWWAMAIVVGIAFAFGKGGAIVLFAFASLVALREFFTIAPTRRGDHRPLVAAFLVVLPVQYFLVWIEWYGMYTIFVPVYAYLFLPIIAALSADTKHFLERAGVVQWGLMISVFCISHVPALLTLDIPGYEGRNLLLVIFLILVVQSSDVLQYVWGKLFGRTKVAPELSPSKTVEGMVGGILSASLIGSMLFWITPFSPLEAFAIALAITIMGFLGGLVMSAIKRDRGVKDWGALIEGHGGMLDRLDSVCFSAPVFFHITRYIWAN